MESLPGQKVDQILNLAHTESRKRKLRASLSNLDPASSLNQLLAISLPDKEHLHAEWLAALAAPAVCITILEDVLRLDNEDICRLPVPPLVKSVFREVLAKEHAKAEDEQRVLDATSARKKSFLAPLRDRNMQPASSGSKYFQEVKRYQLILANEEIDAGIRIVAHRIETWARGERVILVGILKGAFMFMSDLCRALIRPYSVYFVEASSYKDGRQQGGMTINAELSTSKFTDATSKRPHKIVLVDELLDNGKTMQEMKLYFLNKLNGTHTENDVLTCCLFSKSRERVYPEADITGIPNLPDLWLVGYGLDDRGTKRGWSELFAMPKVKIVETFEKEEVDKLLACLDDNAMLTAPHVFAGFELTYNHKQRYRVVGLDISSTSYQSMHEAATKTLLKGDIQNILADVSTVKGKYEHELQFAFISTDLKLVPEDAIFSGNHHIYAQMRTRLRRQIAVAANRFNLQGPAEIL
jgi:hypoxanthine phosphoribosyltransferase